ncbi:DNA repair protein Dds20/Mei5 [Colletotrichum simmondsii]|uniref:DNA repair protein Dds20/Mei5 n=1 Tax=Colletotrichum simmondsii TaxID=703756 RepID=A0A135TZT9_9PEZI|nr:DNA repair protein Dds20/Mei5 [Colletotrichum simmondsii]
MFTPAAKRRRVDAANETLRKPFRSPLVQRDRGRDQDPGPERTRKVSTADVAAAAAAEDPAAEEDGDCDSAAPAATDPAAASSPSFARGAATTTPRYATEKFATPGKRGVSGTFTSTSTATPAVTPTPTRRPFSVPRARGLQLTGASPSPLRTTTAGSYGGPGARKTGPGLGFVSGGNKSEREAEGREEILRQAERIRGPVGEGETDEELVELIGKWRAASRIAAEEVFEGSRERVEGMGGLKAWRRARREDEVRFMAMLEGEKGAGRARRGGCEEWEGDDERDHGEEGGGEGIDEEEEAEEEEFTMGTMLRSMNIDFEIIGYDEDTGWWRDG